MRISADQLSSHLQGNKLLPIYLICGNEPLQIMEATDKIRLHTRQAGADRTVLTVEKGFDWNQILQESANLGLFSSFRLIELRLANHSPGKQGSEVLTSYSGITENNDILMVSMEKLDKRSQSSRWYKAIDKIGAIIQIRPIEPSKLPDWISRRLKLQDKQIERSAAELIAQKTEGNLLATRQELEKLCLLVTSNRITLENVQECVIDSSRYDVFALIEYALRGNGQRVINMLRGLRQEGIEPISIYGAIMWELRRICSISARISDGAPRDRVFNEYRVWNQRQAAINTVLKRFDNHQLSSLLKEAIQIDKSLKGAVNINPWEQMEKILFRIGGIKLMSYDSRI